jgi:hypothetical protein
VNTVWEKNPALANLWSFPNLEISRRLFAKRDQFPKLWKITPLSHLYYTYAKLLMGRATSVTCSYLWNIEQILHEKVQEKTWSAWWGVDPINHSWHHLLTSFTVTVWKMVDQNLYLNIVPSDFTTGTKWKVWCDRDLSLGHGLRNRSRTHNLTRMTTTTWHLSFQEETNKQTNYTEDGDRALPTKWYLMSTSECGILH